MAEPSEETHDIYAWTLVWNDETNPIYNCTRSYEDLRHYASPRFTEAVAQEEAPWRPTVIYFFGPKT